MKEDSLVYVKESAIHGLGLFAKKAIESGKVLGKLQGGPTTEDGPYVLWLDDNNKGFRVNCIFKYINHNSKPNACYYDDLTVVAIKNIRKEEEITHHYGDEWG